MKIDNSSILTLDQIFEMIADVECELFHLGADNPCNDDLKAAKDLARATMISFAKAIGKL